MTVETPTAEVVEEVFPDADRRRTFEGRENLVNARKARELLGWEPECTWRDLAAD